MTKRLMAIISAAAVSTGAAVGLALPALGAAKPDTQVAAFGRCHTGGGRTCVVDGDTIWLNGEKIRIADIDTPETHEPKCPAEAELGRRATERMHSLLNEGAFTMETSGGRNEDRYGRKLRIVTRDGKSLGDILVAEGLAREWDGGRRPWC